MILSLHGLFRGIALLAIASTISAVTLGRFAPKPAHFRILSGSRYAAVSGYHFTNLDRVPRFLDAETGDFKRVNFGGDDVVDCAACSPWQDEQGTQLLVARWNSNNPDQETQGYGLSRFSFPDGQVVDRYELEVVPTSRPCFFHNEPGRILFAAGDGHLYRFQFPDRRGNKNGETKDTKQPQRIAWKTSRPGPGNPFISDPVWPSDPRFGGRLIVSLTYLDSDPKAGHRVYRRAQLWWIKLNEAATEVVEAGRILAPGTSKLDPGVNSELRLPSIGTAPDGSLVLAYIHQPDRYAAYQLRLAPLHFQEETGAPTIDAAQSCLLSESCLTVTPTFSSDGRWVFGLEKPRTPEAPATRYSVTEALQRVTTSQRIALEEAANARR